MNSAIPIIALTADVTTVDLEKCRLVGMNDYLAKPVNEKLLYNKIITHIKKFSYLQQEAIVDAVQTKTTLSIDLSYLIQRTKSNPVLMAEMISIFLSQTPILLDSMRTSLITKNWKTLHAAVHKIIPSFSIMGISVDFETMAKQIKEYAETMEKMDEIPNLLTQIENICTQAYGELEIELKKLKENGNAE
ncbi:MAG: PAS/PAC sensor hybrid histidine kinase, partial [Chitinophagaceae bacterium]